MTGIPEFEACLLIVCHSWKVDPICLVNVLCWFTSRGVVNLREFVTDDFRCFLVRTCSCFSCGVAFFFCLSALGDCFLGNSVEYSNAGPAGDNRDDNLKVSAL